MKMMKMRMRLTPTLAGFILLVFAAGPQLAAQSAVPVVVYQQEGGFIVTPPFLVLTVYTNGDALLIRRTGANPAGTFCHIAATPAQLTQLVQDLDSAAAFFLQDDVGSFVPDLPVATLTYFVPRGPGAHRARSNTFRYGAGAVGLHAQAEQAIQAFLGAVFPAC